MKNKKLLNVIKSKDLVIPGILLLHYRDLKINEKELIFLSLLMSIEDLVIFDPIYIGKHLGFDTNEVIEIMSGLTTKKYIDMVVKKENGKMKEYLDISPLYQKLVLYIIDEEEEITEDIQIYSIIENELGRTLSPIEYETIGGWLNANISEELIKEALKEAVLNGVSNLKYIDKILYEWTKKGYKKASDIKKKNKKDLEEIELFDYDWLDEND